MSKKRTKKSKGERKHPFEVWYMIFCEAHQDIVLDAPLGDLTAEEFAQYLSAYLKR